MPESYNAEYTTTIILDTLIERRMNIADLAEACGVSAANLYPVISGRPPSLNLLLKICKALNMTPDGLLGYLEDD